MKKSILYLATIVSVNIGFAHTVPIETPLGFLPPMAFLVGVVFILRDYAQSEIGHYVILLMLIGCIISYFMASPFVAVASASAFIVSEFMDWLIYTAVKTQFHKRVFYSSFIGVFVDTVIFLPMIGLFSWGAVLIMWLSKMVIAIGIFIYYENKQLLA